MQLRDWERQEHKLSIVLDTMEIVDNLDTSFGEVIREKMQFQSFKE